MLSLSVPEAVLSVEPVERETQANYNSPLLDIMTTPAEVDDFGLPIRRFPTPKNDEPTETSKDENPAATPVADASSGEQPIVSETKNDKASDQTNPPAVESVKDDDKSETFEDARSEQSNPSKDASNPSLVTHETRRSEERRVGKECRN